MELVAVANAKGTTQTWFMLTVEGCLDQNASRGRVVPEMASSRELARCSLVQPGESAFHVTDLSTTEAFWGLERWASRDAGLEPTGGRYSDTHHPWSTGMVLRTRYHESRTYSMSRVVGQVAERTDDNGFGEQVDGARTAFWSESTGQNDETPFLYARLTPSLQHGDRKSTPRLSQQPDRYREWTQHPC